MKLLHSPKQYLVHKSIQYTLYSINYIYLNTHTYTILLYTYLRHKIQNTLKIKIHSSVNKKEKENSTRKPEIFFLLALYKRL